MASPSIPIWLVLFMLCMLAWSQSSSNYNIGGWKAAGRYLSEYLDQETSPCINISQFVCGNFGNQSDPNQWQSYRGEKTIRLIESVVTAIESVDLKNGTAPTYSRYVRKFYSDCTATADDPATVNEAYDVLKDALGEFPPFERAGSGNSSKKETSWYLMGRVQQRLGRQAGAIYTVTIYDPLTIYADVPKQEFPLAYFRNQTLRAAQALQRNIDERVLDESLLEAKALYDEWKRIGEGIRPGEPAADKITISNASTLISTINWESYFHGLLPQDIYAKWVDQNITFEIAKPEIVREIGDVFNNHSVRAAKMLIYGQLFERMLSEYLQTIEQNGGNQLLAEYESQKNATRAVSCATYIMSLMPAALARTYFDYLGEDIMRWRSEVQLIANNVFSAMRLLLNSIGYISPASKERVNKKLDAIKIVPAIPSWILNESRVLQNEFEYNMSSSLFMNYVDKARQQFLKKLQSLVDRSGTSFRSPGDFGSDEGEPPPTFEQNSAFYPGRLTIVIYLGYTLPPIFSVNYPLAVKYGRMGALIGHELMHAFDSDGIRSGVSFDDQLLTDDELQIYRRQQQCLIQQYSQYCYQKLGLCLSGSAASGDNIADIGGLKAAYAAYQFAKEVLGDEPPVPGLTDYSNDQIFFMMYQRWFCSRNTPPLDFVTGDHTPDDTRGPIALRNNPHFAAAFNCPLGSASAPIRPCEMWGDIFDSAKNSVRRRK